MVVMHGLAICSGIGGIDLGLSLVLPDYRTVCHVEREAYAAAVLVSRMADASLAEAPIWDDLATFDGRAWRGLVDIVTAGLPCQPYSVAGKRKGHADERAIWPQFIRVVGEVQPALVFVENVPGFLAYFRPVGEELSRLGYEYQAGLFTAAEVGAPHRRERLFILAHTTSRDREDGPRPSEQLGRVDRRGGQVADTIAGRHDGRASEPEQGEVGRDVAEGTGEAVGDATAARRGGGAGDCWTDRARRAGSGGSDPGMGDAGGEGLEERRPEPEPGALTAAWPPGPSGDWSGIEERFWPATAQSSVRRVAHGLAPRLDRLRACGNGVVPAVAAVAFETLMQTVSAGASGPGAR